MVRGCIQQLVGPAAPGPRRAELCGLRIPLLDYGHRRLSPTRSRKDSIRSRVPGALCALVRVWDLLPCVQDTRTSRSQRVVDLRPGRTNPAQVRQTPLSTNAVHLLAGVARYKRRLHHPAASGDGLAYRSEGSGHHRSVHVWSGTFGQPRTGAGRDETSPLPARGPTLV